LAINRQDPSSKRELHEFYQKLSIQLASSILNVKELSILVMPDTRVAQLFSLLVYVSKLRRSNNFAPWSLAAYDASRGFLLPQS
jgi:hypothetical protein